jgi:LPXTG-motif cell wall-anchored protein
LSKDGDASGAVVTITDTTIRDNGNDDNGFYGGGILISEPNGLTADIVNSTISGNTAFGGGGIYSESPDEEEDPQVLHLSLVDSTVSGNVALTVGGVFVNGGSLSEDSTVDILNSTITANTTESGGPAGAALLGGFTPVIRNSIIAGNIDLPGEYGDLDIQDTESELDVAYSLIGVPSSSASAAVGAGIGNLTGVDPLLGPLADNGGPTLTHLPQSDSPVVGAGDPAFTGLVTDQRGRARVIGVLDMGAVETQPELASTGAANATPVVAGALLLLVLGGGLLLGRRRLAAR